MFNMFNMEIYVTPGETITYVITGSGQKSYRIAGC